MANAIRLILNAVCVITKQKVFGRDPKSWFSWLENFMALKIKKAKNNLNILAEGLRGVFIITWFMGAAWII